VRPYIERAAITVSLETDLTETGSDRQTLPIKGWPDLALQLKCQSVGGIMAEHQHIPLSSVASTADSTWCTVHGSGADPDDCCKTLCILY